MYPLVSKKCKKYNVNILYNYSRNSPLDMRQNVIDESLKPGSWENDMYVFIVNQLRLSWRKRFFKIHKWTNVNKDIPI